MQKECHQRVDYAQKDLASAQVSPLIIVIAQDHARHDTFATSMQKSRDRYPTCSAPQMRVPLFSLVSL